MKKKSNKEGCQKKSRQRWVYTIDQLDILEDIFLKCNGYPDTSTLERLSFQLNIDYERTKTWFQNKRARSRLNNTSHVWERQAQNTKLHTSKHIKSLNNGMISCSETRDRNYGISFASQSQDIPTLASAKGRKEIPLQNEHESSDSSVQTQDEAYEALDLRTEVSRNESHSQNRKRRSVAAVEIVQDVSKHIKQSDIRRPRKKRRTSTPTDINKENQAKQKDNLPSKNSSRCAKQTRSSLLAPPEHPSVSVTTDPNSPILDEPVTASFTMSKLFTNPPLSVPQICLQPPTPANQVQGYQIHNSNLKQENSSGKASKSSVQQQKHKGLTISSSQNNISRRSSPVQDVHPESPRTMVLPLTSPQHTEDMVDKSSPNPGPLGTMALPLTSQQHTEDMVDKHSPNPGPLGTMVLPLTSRQHTEDMVDKHSPNPGPLGTMVLPLTSRQHTENMVDKRSPNPGPFGTMVLPLTSRQHTEDMVDKRSPNPGPLGTMVLPLTSPQRTEDTLDKRSPNPGPLGTMVLTSPQHTEDRLDNCSPNPGPLGTMVLPLTSPQRTEDTFNNRSPNQGRIGTMVLPLKSPQSANDVLDPHSLDSNECRLVISQVCSIKEPWCEVPDQDVRSRESMDAQNGEAVEEVVHVTETTSHEARQTPETNYSKDEDPSDKEHEHSVDEPIDLRTHQIKESCQYQCDSRYEESVTEPIDLSTRQIQDNYKSDTRYVQPVTEHTDLGSHHIQDIDNTRCEQLDTEPRNLETLHIQETNDNEQQEGNMEYEKPVNKDVEKNVVVNKSNSYSHWPYCRMLPVPDDVIVMFISYRYSELGTESCDEDSHCVMIGNEKRIRLPVL